MSENKENKNSKKKRNRPLSKEAIIKMAIKMADRDGLAKLSMRNLAKKLNVEAMSLYNHIKNKDDILDAIVDQIFSEVSWSMDVGWKEAMFQRSISIRGVLHKHRWAIHLLESRPNPGPITLAYHDRVIRCLRLAKFSLKLTGHAFSALDSYTYGFILQEHNLPFENQEQLNQLASMILSNFPKEEYPSLFEFTSDYIFQPDYSHSKEFLYGLELVIEGLDSRFQKEQKEG
ncbi:MAG: TetR/AcrR family transcriptional regulator C-terminal domain-containing protein [Bdellovibrionota bacterium]